MPEDIEFKTKPQIALEQIKWACEAGLPRGVVIIDAGYGVEAKFRSEISALKLKYVAGVKTTNTVWAPGTFASSLAANSRRGRNESPPISVEKLALQLPKSSWQTIHCATARTRFSPRASPVLGSVPHTIAMLRGKQFQRSGS